VLAVRLYSMRCPFGHINDQRADIAGSCHGNRRPLIPLPCVKADTREEGARRSEIGQNRTRPPPCMRWRGPCLAASHQVSRLPCLTLCRTRRPVARPPGTEPRRPVAQPPRPYGPPAGAVHPREVPVSRFLSRPRSSLRVVPVSDGEVFLLPRRGAAQGFGAKLLRIS